MNWSQARPPIAIATAIAITAPAIATVLSTVGWRERSSAHPVSFPSRRSSRRRPANSAIVRAIPASRIRRTVTPWSIVDWLATLSARLSRAWIASSAGSAPIAPIASVASIQSRSRERAIRIPAEIRSASRPPRE